MGNTADSFDKNLDKITEREVVYDFYERLPIGNDIKILNSDNNDFDKNTLLQTIIKKLMYALPRTISEDLSNLRSYKFNTSPLFLEWTFVLRNATKVICAISDRTGVDIIDCMNITHDEVGDIIVNYIIDTPYTNDDIITVYYI